MWIPCGNGYADTMWKWLYGYHVEIAMWIPCGNCYADTMWQEPRGYLVSYTTNVPRGIHMVKISGCHVAAMWFAHWE